MSQFSQISEGEWKELTNPYQIACLNVEPEYLATLFGIRFLEFYDDGLGPAKLCFLQVGDKQFLLISHFNEPMFVVSVLSYESDPIQALEVLLGVLALNPDKFSWIREELGHPKWLLYRVDDNGNEIEMYRFHEEHSAQYLRLSYEKKGHKQVYLVTKIT